MTVLTVVGEPLPGFEAAAHAAATRDLALALSLTAPRGCSALTLLAADSPHTAEYTEDNENVRIPQRYNALPYLWRTGSAGRSQITELVHAMTPLAPVHARKNTAGSQVSVLVPHALAWEAPDTLNATELRATRTFVKRAIKHADVILTPTHAVAYAIAAAYGTGIPLQVLPLAAPAEFLKPIDGLAAAARRAELKLPEMYLTTTANVGAAGRLEWLFSALIADQNLPPLVVLAPVDISLIPRALLERVIVLAEPSLADVGIVLAGTSLFVCPQRVAGTGYELLGALSSAIPILHTDCLVATEIVLDAGRSAATETEFSQELADLLKNPDELAKLSILAEDRSRSFSWANTAQQLWEVHANL